MDQHTFVFATRGHCIKGKQWQHITIKNQNMSYCSKQSSLFYFYTLPSGGKSKGAVVQFKFKFSFLPNSEEVDVVYTTYSLGKEWRKSLGTSFERKMKIYCPAEFVFVNTFLGRN